MTTVAGAQGYAAEDGWLLLNDVWNPGKLTYGADYTIQAAPGAASLTNGTTFSWSFPQSTFSYTNVVAYPDVLFGDSPWGRGQSDPTDVFPIQLSNLTSAQLGYNLAWGGAASGYDVSYDMFFTSVPNGGQSTITNEVMIWMHAGDLTPYGAVVGKYSDGGFSGTIHYSTSGDNGTYTAIIANTDSEVGTVDLAHVVQTLESLNILKSSEYLASISLGAEVVQGAGSLTINQSTINVVNGNTSSGVNGLAALSVSQSAAAVTTKDTASVKPFTGVAITDSAAGQTETATVALSAAANGTLSDPNAATDGSTVVNGVLTVSGSSAQVAAALDGLLFTPTQNQVAAGAAVTASATSTITATQVAATSSPADTLALQISEDAWKGDAEFTVSVDGKQVGGDYAASALHSSGDAGTFLLTGDWGSGVNDVQVSFINDAYGGNPDLDRNLYVNSIAYDGVTYAGTTASLYVDGTASFAVGGTTQTAAGPADTLTLNLSEDAWNGNAEFVLLIDGKAVSTPQAVTALHDQKATQAFTFTGNLGAGTHTVGVEFVNDAYGGSSSEDRNLYIDGITLNGSSVFSGVKAQYSDGTSVFTVTATH